MLPCLLTDERHVPKWLNADEGSVMPLPAAAVLACSSWMPQENLSVKLSAMKGRGRPCHHPLFYIHNRARSGAGKPSLSQAQSQTTGGCRALSGHRALRGSCSRDFFHGLKGMHLWPAPSSPQLQAGCSLLPAACEETGRAGGEGQRLRRVSSCQKWRLKPPCFLRQERCHHLKSPQTLPLLDSSPTSALILGPPERLWTPPCSAGAGIALSHLPNGGGCFSFLTLKADPAKGQTPLQPLAEQQQPPQPGWTDRQSTEIAGSYFSGMPLLRL